MSEVLIFGGTTEGRKLAEFCAESGIRAAVCVTTEYGASLLPEGICVLSRSRDAAEMQTLMRERGTRLCVDATHPYAKEATQNIRLACEKSGVRYVRLLRETVQVAGETVHDLTALVERLNRQDGVILSTLGSRSLPALTGVQGYAERLWLRLLPAEETAAQCEALGFPAAHILWGRGPFSVAENIAHLRQSGAALLVTKESGRTGGYPEKLAAAEHCGIPTLTLVREQEEGLTLAAVTALLQREEIG